MDKYLEVSSVMNFLARKARLGVPVDELDTVLSTWVTIDGSKGAPPPNRAWDLMFVIRGVASKATRKKLQASRVCQASAKARVLYLEPAVIAKEGTPVPENNPGPRWEAAYYSSDAPAIQAWANTKAVQAAMAAAS